MSKAAGTLITTNQATYIPPRFMPGYDGHVPTLKFDYGETYGNGTARYFQDFRYHTMGTSREDPNSRGYFATAYTHRPDLATEWRTRSWDRWVQEPRYRLTHCDHDRREELINFAKRSAAHRENYSDKTSTVPKVAHFQLPVPAEMQFKSCQPFVHRAFRYSDAINIANWDRQPQLDRYIPPATNHRASVEERDLHDLYFPTRHKYGM